MFGFLKKLFGGDAQTNKEVGVQIEQVPYKVEAPVAPPVVETPVTQEKPAPAKKAQPKKKAAPKKAAPAEKKPRGPKKSKA